MIVCLVLLDMSEGGVKDVRNLNSLCVGSGMVFVWMLIDMMWLVYGLFR